MKIRAIKKLPRLLVIPGAIVLVDYRALQRSEAVEVPQESAAWLIEKGYTEPVEEAAPIKEEEHEQI